MECSQIITKIDKDAWWQSWTDPHPEPNQIIHVDLFGPLKPTNGEKKYILCMTDTFTKYTLTTSSTSRSVGTNRRRRQLAWRQRRLEGLDTWRRRKKGPGHPGFPAGPDQADQPAGGAEGSNEDKNFDFSSTAKQQQEDYCVKVFKETNNLEFEAEPALLRQQHQEHLEQLRDRSAKAQQQLWRIQQYTSPDIQANIKSCPPRTKLPADDDYTPIPKPRRSIQKPGRIQLQLEALEDQLKLRRSAFFDCEKCIPFTSPIPPLHTSPHHIAPHHNTTPKAPRYQRI